MGRIWASLGLIGACSFDAPIIGDGFSDARPGVDEDAAVPDASNSDAGDAGSTTRVVTGTVSLSGLISVDVAIDPPIDPNRAMLIFSLSVDSARPDTGHVRGQIAGPSAVRFQRVATSSSGRVAFHVVEAPDLLVQRGTFVLPDDGSDIADIPITPIARERSFVLISLAKAGGIFDPCDYVRAILFADRIEVSVGENALDGLLEWQVVTLAEGSVNHGTIDLADDEVVREIAVGPIDMGRAFLSATWNVTGGGGVVGPHVVRPAILGPGSIAFNRMVGGAQMSIAYQIVTIPSARVFHDIPTVARGDLAVSSTLAEVVDPSRSIVFLSGNQRAGATDLIGDPGLDTDNIGSAWYTAELTDDRTVRVERAVNGLGRGRPAFFVVELP